MACRTLGLSQRYTGRPPLLLLLLLPVLCSYKYYWQLTAHGINHGIPSSSAAYCDRF
jgi:hypothetical protein